MEHENQDDARKRKQGKRKIAPEFVEKASFSADSLAARQIFRHPLPPFVPSRMSKAPDDH
jgi:hypothetical protein